VRILAVQDTDQGKKTHVIHGKVGVFDMAAKSAYLQRDVVIVLDDAEAEKDRTRIYADDLLWDGKTGTAKTEGPVRVERPDMTITGVGMTVYRGEKTKKTAKAPPAKNTAPAPATDAAANLRQGNVVIHRHEKTTVRPDKGQWLVPMADVKPSAGAPGKAKPAKANPARKSPPIVITSTGPLTIDRAAGVAVYKHNVRAVQGPQSLTSDEMRLGFKAGGTGAGGAALSSVVAIGHVRMDDGDTFALADQATWQRDTNTLVLIGRPAEVRWDNGNRISAGCIRRLNNGEILHCTHTDKHPGNAFLMIYSAEEQAGAKPGKAPAVAPGSALPVRPATARSGVTAAR